MVGATLDVNVLVSAAISPRGVPSQILEAWQAQRFEVITSQHIIDQLVLKLRSDRIGRRYGLTVAAIRDFTAPLRRDARRIVLPPDAILPVTGDPEDDAVLATARLGQAAYLVTGDGGLLARSPYADIPIIAPRAFLDLLGS
jgi:putative PIN family toxin of toxin-antitoxin system